MHLHEHVLSFLSLIVVFSFLATSAPTQSSSFNLATLNNDFSAHDLRLPRLPNNIIANSTRVSPSLRNTTQLSYLTDWPVSDTLSLRIETGDWRLPDARIVQILDDVQKTVGKKVSSAHLTEKFVVSTGRYLNTMVFEIIPKPVDEGLQWADVADIVGSRGLPLYFQRSEQWRSTFFDIHRIDGNKFVEIGKGAVRKKWYQLDFPNKESSTGL